MKFMLVGNRVPICTFSTGWDMDMEFKHSREILQMTPYMLHTKYSVVE